MDSWNHLVRPQGLDDKHFLEVVQFFLPVLREVLLVSICRVENVFEFVGFLHEVLINTLEVFKTCGHSFELFVDVRPGCLGNPCRRIAWYFYLASRSDQQKSKLVLVELFVTEKNLRGEHEREN